MKNFVLQLRDKYGERGQDKKIKKKDTSKKVSPKKESPKKEKSPKEDSPTSFFCEFHNKNIKNQDREEHYKKHEKAIKEFTNEAQDLFIPLTQYLINDYEFSSKKYQEIRNALEKFNKSKMKKEILPKLKNQLEKGKITTQEYQNTIRNIAQEQVNKLLS